LFRLRRENEQLETEIAEESSITRLRERAEELELGPADRLEYLVLAGDR
jgi:hypothetical protein